jgi:hypothetical protein
MIVKYLDVADHSILLTHEAPILPVPRVGEAVNIHKRTFGDLLVKRVRWVLDIDNRCTVEVVI